MSFWGTDLGKTLIVTPAAVLALGGGLVAWEVLDVGDERAAITACKRAVERQAGTAGDAAGEEVSEGVWSVKGATPAGLYHCEVDVSTDPATVLTVSAG